MQAHLKTNAQRCEHCIFMMPSYSASTRYRCGFQYFQLPLIERKLKTMSHYPEVELSDSCKKWRNSTRSTMSTPPYSEPDHKEIEDELTSRSSIAE